VFNLNDTPHSDIPAEGTFDLICFNEVLEHLYTAPETVIPALVRLLRPGGTMVIQTPNAAALNKRLMLLIGRNPYERIRTDLTNPGHLRELTKAELAEIVIACDLDILDHRCIEHTGVYGRSWRNVALPFLKAAAAIHPTFARSQQIIVRKP
jgi:2-polyprenyl-3-methyl-5-hydroxy-6-metoxy-1,4-benzoquinol methylase